MYSTNDIFRLWGPILSIYSSQPLFTLPDVPKFPRSPWYLEETDLLTSNSDTPFIETALHAAEIDHARELEKTAGPDSEFLDRGFELAEGGSICAVWSIFPEIPHENEII